MARPRSRLLDYLVYLLVRFFVCLVQSLTLESADRMAALLAWLAYRLDKRHRAVADENLRLAFPHLTSASDRDIQVRAVYRHFCRLLMEIILMPRRLHLNNWKQYLDLPRDVGRQVIECLLADRPLIMISGHFGNWELAGYALGMLGFTTHGVARPLDNPYLDRFLHEFRECTGQKLLAKKGDYGQMQLVLAEGGVLAFLVDQDAGQRGLYVDFFNRPASTHKAIALLALEYRAPLLVIFGTNRGQTLRYRVSVEDLILPEDYEGQPDAVRAITQRFTAALQRGIGRAPEQYFWLHRRWKHQPGKAKSSPGGSKASKTMNKV